MDIVIRPPQPKDRAEWIRMRSSLWPDESPEEHDREVTAFIHGYLAGWLAGLHAVAVFVAARHGGLCGFVEASVRPLAEGCSTHPVGYVEGWYVDPDARRQGVGRRLIEAAESWALASGCREMASDAYLDNVVSIAAHRRLGFADEPPTVQFRKWLPGAEGKCAPTQPLVVLPGIYAVCRLDADDTLPPWVAADSFVTISRTGEELSIVCRQEMVPQGVRCDREWRCMRVAGTLGLNLVGVLASLLGPLAVARVSVFVVSTFDTDYVLVKDAAFAQAIEVLRRAGHEIAS